MFNNDDYSLNQIQGKKTIQQKIMRDLNVELPDPDESHEEFIQRIIQERIHFMIDYIKRTPAQGFTLGISGGVDSFVTSMLAMQTGYPLHLISIPCGVQKDMDDVEKSVAVIKPHKFWVHNIGSVSIATRDEMLNNINGEINKYVIGNIQARQRMIVQYAYGQQYNHLVLGTDHATEAVVGYYTKGGDGMADLMPISGLTKDVIYDIAKFFNAPETIITKAPAAGLGISNSDEEELKIKYSDICSFLQDKEIDPEIANRIVEKYKQTEHKRHLPATPSDCWWW